MKLFKDTKRRAKQQLMQTIGLVSAHEDSDFQAEYAEFKTNVVVIRNMQATMRGYIAATKKQYEFAAAMSMELAHFHQGTLAAESAVALAQANTDSERTQMAAVERLFEEEVISAADLILWQVPEIEERVRERKKLLLDLNSYTRKYEASMQSLADSQNQPYGGGGNTLLLKGRRKSENELGADAALRKMRLEQAEQAVSESTEWCLEQFRALLDLKESGKVLSGPMAAILSCQRKLNTSGAQKLDRIKKLFPQSEKFDQTLTTYELEFVKLQEAGSHDLFANFKTHGLAEPEEFAFGLPLGPTCPRVVTEIVQYLEAHALLTEGLFRIPGSQDRVFELRDKYNAGEMDCLARSDPHDVAALLKRFLLDLPDSLVPQAFYASFVHAVTQEEQPMDEALADVMGELPEEHLVCLSPVLLFLFHVGRQSHKNKMTFQNLATCLAPTMLRAPEGQTHFQTMNDMQPIILGFQTLIEQAERYDLRNQEECPGGDW